MKIKHLLILICLTMSASLNAAPLKTSVKVLEVIPGKISTQLNYTGYLAPDQRVSLRSESEGTIEKIRVQEGQLVEKDTILVHISTETLSLNVKKARSDYELAVANYEAHQTSIKNEIEKRSLLIALQSAKANMERAMADYEVEKKIANLNLSQKQLLLKKQMMKSNYDLALSEYEKEQQLMQRNMSSQSRLDSYRNKSEVQKVNLELAELDLASSHIKSDDWRLENAKTVMELRKLEYEKARLALEDYNAKTDDYRLEAFRNRMTVAKVQLDQALLDYEKSLVRAPFTGIIREKKIENGGYIRKGEPLLEMIEISEILVKINVPETQIRHLKLDQIAEVRLDAYPKDTFKGALKTIGLEADLKTRSFPVEIRLSNKNQKLLPGMMSRVSIAQPEKENQVIIPGYAIIEKEHNKVVFVEEEGKAVERVVKTGEKLEGDIQILTGVNAGDKLIVSGHQFLSDKDDVLVIETSKQMARK